MQQERAHHISLCTGSQVIHQPELGLQEAHTALAPAESISEEREERESEAIYLVQN